MPILTQIQDELEANILNSNFTWGRMASSNLEDQATPDYVERKRVEFLDNNIIDPPQFAHNILINQQPGPFFGWFTPIIDAIKFKNIRILRMKMNFNVPYIGASDISDEIKALQEEITSLRIQLLQAQTGPAQTIIDTLSASNLNLPELPEVPNLDIPSSFDINISGDNKLGNNQSSAEKRKKRAAAKKELQRKRKKGVVSMGGMSDPYNHIEQKLFYTRQALESIYKYSISIWHI